MQVADLQMLEATIDASMPSHRATEESGSGVHAEQSMAEASEAAASMQEARAQLLGAAVRQPGCLAAAQPIAAGNVGMRLLEKMGWQEGSGACLYCAAMLLPTQCTQQSIANKQ